MRQDAPIPLGLFDLHEPIARGGMGEVWRGLHREQQIPVAVKVITTAHAREAKHQRAFEREVEAIAGLEHPGIVMVLDYGIVPDVAETETAGHLIAGSPYLVMELARRGVAPREHWPWERLRSLLLAILEALAHAHARGVIHRDLKPANVLFFEEDESVAKLADFGIAWVAGRDLEAQTVGTPRYMAPEQIVGDWLDYGPCTDLYALGCMAWRLTTGTFPFKASMMSKLTGHPGAFRPLAAVPEAFEPWLHALLVREPRNRVQRAADAAYALAQMPTVSDPDGASHSAPLSAPRTTRSIGRTGVTPRRSTVIATDAGRMLVTPPPMSDSWARQRVKRSLQLFGAGLALYGLRRPHMVGRIAERDALWSALAEVVSSRRAGAVVLRGAAGTGKSRLAQWLCERAHELGATTALKSVSSVGGGPMDGLAQMVTRHLKCSGLPRVEVVERIAHLLPQWGADESEALAELIFPRGREKGTAVVEITPEDRVRLVRRLLGQLCGERALIVWLDDAQWGEESLDLASALLSTEGDSIPVLVVMTVRKDALGVSPESKEKLANFSAQSNALELDVEPLGASERSELVRDLLGLSTALADQVEQRTAGVPLFAVQLIGDWVQRGLLVLGPAGFQLREGVEQDLPDALHGLWADRVEHLLDGRAETDRMALEIASVLGPHVNSGEWRSACEHLGVPIPEDLVDLMVVRDMATRIGDDDWAFVHGMLAESVVRESREADRLDGQRSACAEALHELGMVIASRGGGQLRNSEQVYRRALVIAPDRAFRAVIRCSMGMVFWRRGQMDEARNHFEAALPVHEEFGDRRGQALALYHLGVLDMRQGKPRAEAYLEAALAIDREVGNRESESIVLISLGNLNQNRGHIAEATPYYEAALTLARALGNRTSESLVLANLGNLHTLQGHLSRARDCYEGALPALRELGQHRAVGIVLGNCAALFMDLGDTAGAEERVVEALRILEEIGDRHSRGAFLGILALIRADGGRAEEAWQHLEEGERLLRETGDENEVAKLLCYRGEVALLTGNRDVAQESLKEAQRVAADLEIRPISELGRAIAKLTAGLHENEDSDGS